MIRPELEALLRWFEETYDERTLAIRENREVPPDWIPPEYRVTWTEILAKARELGMRDHPTDLRRLFDENHPHKSRRGHRSRSGTFTLYRSQIEDSETGAPVGFVFDSIGHSPSPLGFVHEQRIVRSVACDEIIVHASKRGLETALNLYGGHPDSREGDCMAATPQLKVYSAGGEYLGALKHPEDAAVLVSALGERASVRLGHGRSCAVWIEGEAYDGDAGESYDGAAAIMRRRLDTGERASWNPAPKS